MCSTSYPLFAVVSGAVTSSKATEGRKASQSFLVKEEVPAGASEGRQLRGRQSGGQLRGAGDQAEKQSGGQVGRGEDRTSGQKRVVAMRIERVRRGVQGVSVKDGGRAQRREERERRKSLTAERTGKNNAGSKGNSKRAHQGKVVAEKHEGGELEENNEQGEDQTDKRSTDDRVAGSKDQANSGGSESDSDSDDDVWEVVEEKEMKKKIMEQELARSKAEEAEGSENEGEGMIRAEEIHAVSKSSGGASAANKAPAVRAMILASLSTSDDSDESDDGDVVEVLPRPAGKMRSKQVTAFETVVQQWDGFLKG